VRHERSGESLIPEIRPALRRALKRHLAGFTAAEIDSLKRYLSRLIESGHRQQAQ
jgi:DNA-binding MarR family transcriptional regulator